MAGGELERGAARTFFLGRSPRGIPQGTLYIQRNIVSEWLQQSFKIIKYLLGKAVKTLYWQTGRIITLVSFSISWQVDVKMSKSAMYKVV